MTSIDIISEKQLGPNNTSKDTNDQPSKDLLSMDDKLLIQLNDVVNENLSNDQFSVENLAEEVAMSRSHLHRKLNKLTGQSISQFIREIRLKKAHIFLVNEVGTVSEIAFKVGFGSSSYFIKCFAEYYGYSPGETKNKTSFQPEVVEGEAPLKPKESAFELLHPSGSEHVINEIFSTMVRFKPSLEKFLIVDEDEGESVDTRLLAYQIFKNYPWPMGVEIRRLFSMGMSDSNDARNAQLEKTILRSIRLLYFVVVSELIRLRESHEMKLDPETKTHALDGLETISKEGLIKGLNALDGVVNKKESDFFGADLIETLDESFYREIKDWGDIDSTGAADEDSPADTLEQIATFVIKKCAFLLKYKFVNISSIEVIKGKFSEASFEHNIQILSNSDPDFKIHQEVLDSFSDSHSVLLMKSVKNSQEFINLSPFVIDTHYLQGKNTEQNVQPDLFLFDGLKEGLPTYIGTEITQPTDLTDFGEHRNLGDEMDEIIRRLQA